MKFVSSGSAMVNASRVIEVYVAVNAVQLLASFQLCELG